MKNEEATNEINFLVPLSGSQLFDINTELTAMNLCAKFPGLKYEILKNKSAIKIFGTLNDYWYKQWNKDLFNKLS